MTLLLTYLLIAIGVSFLCSILEAVLLSVTPGFVASQQTDKPRRAKALQNVKENLDESISSILILNTFAHTMGAAGVGAQALKVFGTQYETLVAFLLTLAILYLSEIIPKTLGARYWKQLALPAAQVIQVLVKLLYPLVWFSAKLTALFGRGGHSSAISRDELAAMARLGASHGSLGSQESELLENMLKLRQTRTEDILTPRTVVSAIDASLTVGEALAKLAQVPFTRLPVYEESLDTIVGMALRPTLHEVEREDGENRPLRDFIIPINRVSGELPVLRLLDLFIKRREHMFLVEDEYGQTEGIVTLEDAVETLLGREIMDESDTVEDMQELARNKYRGRLRDSN
ncbi:transporter [Halioglobus sp. HI00S01]|uniref:CNNM domain-containing protein n=1 Tax=Halioglobus sp. HI00S01 TaxID=1822214 RepID=UPI0007C30021|nr:hemolysin family protein [Halioglobus sp. HI00S01]KZX58373.1 transporter [Halioglobus sp. HI00S01]